MQIEPLDQNRLEAAAKQRPTRITLELSPLEVELALATGGASLCEPALRALVLASVLDADSVVLQ